MNQPHPNRSAAVHDVICMACGATAEAWLPGPGGRANAACGQCGALERHRFLAILLRVMRPTDRVVLDVGPMAVTTKVLRGLKPRIHLRTDLDPRGSGRRVEVLADLTALPVRTRSVDLAICYHVLEHVPDDAAAISEIARVLADDGTALIQVPIRLTAPTDEDPSADAETRLRRFGQADHVRVYGTDFDDRLRRGGLHITRLRPLDVLGPDLAPIFGVNPNEYIWLATRSDGTVAPPDPEGLRSAILAVCLQVLGASYAAARRDNARLKDQVLRLKGKLRHARRAPRSAAGRWPSVRRRLVGAMPRRWVRALRRARTRMRTAPGSAR